jgi:hypothetical protein
VAAVKLVLKVGVGCRRKKAEVKVVAELRWTNNVLSPHSFSM